MKGTRAARFGGTLVLAALMGALVAGPAQAIDIPFSGGISGSGTYTGTQNGDPVTGDIDVDLHCIFIVCFGSVKVNGEGGLTIGFTRTPDAPYEVWLSGIQIRFGGDPIIQIRAASLQAASDGSFVWGSGDSAITGQLDSGGFTIS